MKIKTQICRLSLGALLLLGAANGHAQNQVYTDPAQGWGGYMNVFDLNGNYQFGSGWAGADLRARFEGNLLILQANTNVSNPSDPYWVNPDGSGNKIMQANWYVDTASLVGSNITFSGNVVDYTLAAGYETRAFIKLFNGNYSAVLQEVSTPLTNGNSFFSINLTADAAGGGHVQYGFVTTGPNAPATSSPASDGFISIRTKAANPKNVLVNPSFEEALLGWTSYGNGGNIETANNTYYNNNNPVGASNVLVYDGLRVQKVFPTFTGGENFSGIFQDVPTGAGSTWAGSAKLLTHPQDQIGVWDPDGTNQAWIEITFRDSGNNVLGEAFRSQIIDRTTPAGVWINAVITNHLDGGTTLTAPAGTVKVRFQEVYRQPFGFAGGSVYADQMVLENLTPSDPNITSLPVNQTRVVGETATFTILATGATPLSYQWKTNGVNLVDGNGVSGSTSNTLTIANVQKSQAGVYTVEVTDEAGTLSATVTLVVKTCAEAVNVLENPSFETGTYSPWIAFNGGGIKANDEFYGGIFVTNFDGTFGSVVENGGEFNGAFQDVPATPGQIFTADGWFFEPSTFPLTEGNQVWLEVQFRNGGTPLALYKSTVISTNNPNRPLDTWYNLQATNGFAGDFSTPIDNALFLVAPAGTTTVRYQVTMRVVGGSGGVLYDAMRLLRKLPVTITSVASAGSLNLTWPTQCSTSYQVEFTENLGSGVWNEIGGVVEGDGAVKSASFPTTGSQRFFRVSTQ